MRVVLSRYITGLGYYKGWHIWRDDVGSQKWKARKHGVRICNIDREKLLDMIDLRHEQQSSL